MRTIHTQLIIADAVRDAGWTDETLIDVLTEYIGNQGDNATFADFIAEKVESDLGPQ